MLMKIVFVAVAVAAAHASSLEDFSSDVEEDSQRSGVGLLSYAPAAESPDARRHLDPNLTYKRLLQLNRISPIGYHYGCSIGIPTVFGCAIQMINGKFLIVGPLLEDFQHRVKPIEVNACPLIASGFICSVGFPTVIGCFVQEINGKWLYVDPLRS